MKKKVVLLLLISVLALSACNNAKESDEASEPEQQEEVSEQEEEPTGTEGDATGELGESEGEEEDEDLFPIEDDNIYKGWSIEENSDDILEEIEKYNKAYDTIIPKVQYIVDNPSEHTLSNNSKLYDEIDEKLGGTQDLLMIIFNYEGDLNNWEHNDTFEIMRDNINKMAEATLSLPEIVD
ncbi:MAG: hypothetical protein ACRC3H_23570 [Lachnospiraceae bacterium]